MSTSDVYSESLTNLSRPRTSATLTLRIIKSFEYRTEKSLVVHNVNLDTTTVGMLKVMAYEAIRGQRAWRPYHSLVEADDKLQTLDTLKLYTKAHGAKTTNLIINLDHDEWILEDDSKSLSEIGLENESEVSFFNRKTYEAFKANPITRWD